MLIEYTIQLLLSNTASACCVIWCGVNDNSLKQCPKTLHPPEEI